MALEKEEQTLFADQQSARKPLSGQPSVLGSSADGVSPAVDALFSRLQSDALIERTIDAALEAGHSLIRQASDADFVAICTDEPGDLWTLYPVREADERGMAVVVESKDGSDGLTHRLRQRKAQLLVMASDIADRDGVRALCWQPVASLVGMREAVRPFTTRAAIAKASPSPGGDKEDQGVSSAQSQPCGEVASQYSVTDRSASVERD